MKFSILNRIAFSAIAITFTSLSALALPADFTGFYEILQSRTLGLTAGGRGYVLQDGSLVSEANADPARTFCRSAQTKFDETKGDIDVKFVIAVDGSEHATLTTLPSLATSKPTTIECVSAKGFSGALDLSVALGRIVEISK